MNKTITILSLIPLLLVGCKSVDYAKTVAEQKAGYTYVPLEPTTVSIENNYPILAGKQKNMSKSSLLNALPDNSVRVATRQIDGKVKAGIPTIGAEIGYAGNTYEIILDYVNTQTINQQFYGKWFVNVPDTVTKLNRPYPYEHSVLEKPHPDKYESWTLKAHIKDSDRLQNEIAPEARINVRTPNKTIEEVEYKEFKIDDEPFNIPVYVGIGLRIRATVTVNEGKVNITSLPALTAAVEAKRASGTMSVQTIGITGRAARSNLLLVDKIDASTIQSAIQVLASIKTSIESSDTTISPRILGFHNTVDADAQGINLIHSLLASKNTITLELDPQDFATGATDSDSTTSGK